MYAYCYGDVFAACTAVIAAVIPAALLRQMTKASLTYRPFVRCHRPRYVTADLCRCSGLLTVRGESQTVRIRGNRLPGWNWTASIWQRLIANTSVATTACATPCQPVTQACVCVNGSHCARNSFGLIALWVRVRRRNNENPIAGEVVAISRR